MVFLCGLERNTLLFRVWCIIKLYDSHSHICFSFVTEMYQCVRILWCITFILTVIISIDGKKLYVITNVFNYFNNVLWLFIKFSTLTQCDINKYFQIFLFWKRSRHTHRERVIFTKDFISSTMTYQRLFAMDISMLPKRIYWIINTNTWNLKFWIEMSDENYTLICSTH